MADKKKQKDVKPNLRDFGGMVRASNIFLSQASRTRKAVLNQSERLVDLFNLLNETKKKRNVVHVTGMGRSGRAVEFFADMLKDLGFKVSIIGRTLALPVSVSRSNKG